DWMTMHAGMRQPEQDGVPAVVALLIFNWTTPYSRPADKSCTWSSDTAFTMSMSAAPALPGAPSLYPAMPMDAWFAAQSGHAAPSWTEAASAVWRQLPALKNRHQSGSTGLAVARSILICTAAPCGRSAGRTKLAARVLLPVLVLHREGLAGAPPSP